MTRRHRFFASAPDPVADRLLSYALARQGGLLDAVAVGTDSLGVTADKVGVLLGGDNPACPFLGPLLRSELWQKAHDLGLDVPAGLPRFFPVLVTLGREACVCWIGPLPDDRVVTS